MEGNVEFGSDRFQHGIQIGNDYLLGRVFGYHLAKIHHDFSSIFASFIKPLVWGLSLQT
jgi:hypothetical protein